MIMEPYKDLLVDVIFRGKDRTDRTGTGTRSVFGRQARFDLREGFPLLTTKSVPFKLVAAELLWFLSGSTNNNDLARLSGCAPEKTIWAEWATETGDLGPIYGEQFRRFPTCDGGHVDQIREVVSLININPNSRRLVVSAWNPGDLPEEGMSPQLNAKNGFQALAPCHVLFQFYVQDGELSCQMYQRSADIFLGVPFNIASYALLTHMVADQCGLTVGDLIISFGDLHLYKNHFKQAEELLRREPRLPPKLQIVKDADNIFSYTLDHFEIKNYHPHPAIPAPVAV